MVSQLQQDDNILVNEKEEAQSQQVPSSSHQAPRNARRHGSALHRFFSKVRGVAARLWPHVRPVVGIPLIYIGVALMVFFYFTNLTNYNLLLFLPLLLITVGIIGKVALK
jgi:hypothetical protein